MASNGVHVDFGEPEPETHANENGNKEGIAEYDNLSPNVKSRHAILPGKGDALAITSFLHLTRSACRASSESVFPMVCKPGLPPELHFVVPV